VASVALAIPSQVEPKPPYWSDDLRDILKLANVNKPVHSLAGAAASISFHPDRGVYEARRTTRAAEKGLEKALPPGWPETLQGPLVWKGSDFNDDAEFAFQLSASDMAEIEINSQMAVLVDRRRSLFESITRGRALSNEHRP